jgi:hypothetical protein
VENSNDVNAVIRQAIEDEVRESPDNPHAEIPMNERIHLRLPQDLFEAGVGAAVKLAPEARTASLIPVDGLQQLVLGLRTKDQSHLRAN